MQKLKSLIIAWLLISSVTFIGSQITLMTFQWCVDYNNQPPAKVAECAERSYTSWYRLGRAMQFNPVSHLFYFARSIIDGE